MKKKILSVILSIALLAGTVLIPSNEPMVVTAIETDDPTATIEWETEAYGEGVAVTKYKGIATDVFVPAKLIVGGVEKNVLKLGDGLFANNDGINSVTLAEGIIEIGARAFYDADALVCIVTNQTLAKIGDEAFFECDAFNSVILPQTLTTIGDNAFGACPQLTIWCNEETAAYRYATENAVPCKILNPEVSPEIYTLDGVTYYIFNGNAVAVDCDETVIKVTLPATVNGYPVTELRETFRECKNLVSVTLPDTLTKIGDDAFYYCDSLVSVDLPEGLKTIGDEAFYYCYSLTSIDLPEELETIGSSAFSSCGSLTNIDLPDGLKNIASFAFSGCTSLASIDLPEGLKTIGDEAFSYCDSLTSVDFPEGLETMGMGAFSGCRSLTSIDLPDGLETIDTGTFSYCDSLVSIDFPEELKLIGYSAFYQCDSLASVDLPEGLEMISNEAFHGCSALETVIIPRSVTNLLENPFSNTTVLMVYENSYAHTFAESNGLLYQLYGGANTPVILEEGGIVYFITNGEACAVDADENITEAVIPATVNGYPVTELRETFRECKNLVSVTLPDTLTKIGDDAFYYCDSLVSVDLPEGLKTIGDEAFYYCYSLTSIDLPKELETIGSSAFSGCGSLASIDLPDGLKNIASFAFSGCTSLASIDLPEGLKTIGDEAFSYCDSLTSVDFPEGLETMGMGAFSGCRSLTSIDLPDGLETIDTGTFSYCDSLVSIDFPEELKLIGYSAFYQCDSLASVDLPEGLEMISNEAFHGCSALETVIIPRSVTNLLENPFSNTTVLMVYENSYAHIFAESNGLLYQLYGGVNTPVILEEGGIVYFITNGEACAVDADENITEAVIPATVNGYPVTELRETFRECKNLVSVTLPDTLTKIGDDAFYYCDSLVSVDLPEGLKTIGDEAFYYCYSLTSIDLPEELETIGSSAFSGCGSLTSIDLPDGLENIASFAFFGCTSLASIDLPEGLKTIGDEAFSCCDSLTSVDFPEGLETMGMGAFSGCRSLTSIDLPDGLKTIDTGTFSYCDSLVSIDFPEELKLIGYSAFYQCDSLASVDLPEGLEMISDAAFHGCSALETVIIPRSVTNLLENPFSNTTVLMVYENSYAHTFAESNGLLYFVLQRAENPEIRYGTGVSGTVTYIDGSIAKNATVEILYEDGTLKESVLTDENGAYTFTYAEVGRYTVRVTDALGNTASETLSVKRMNAFEVFLTGNTALKLKKAYTVSGSVTNATDATVTLSDLDGNLLYSTQAMGGNFAFENVSGGTYLVKAETSKGSGGTEITVYNANVTDITLTIDPVFATVWGYVSVQNRDESIERRIWVNVVIYNADGVAVAQAKSDKDGKYLFENLPLGEYTILAEVEELRTDYIGGYDRNYQLTGYAYVNASAAMVYELEEIILTEAEASDKTVEISGKVTAQGGSQAGEVILENVFHHEIATCKTNNNGKFTFKNVRDGLYFLVARTEKDGMGCSVVVVRDGELFGTTNITVYKSDKIQNRESIFTYDLGAVNENNVKSYKDRIIEEKVFYDGLSKKEKKQLSDSYVERLNQLVAWLSDFDCNVDDDVQMDQGGLIVSGDELASDSEISFTLTVTKQEEWKNDGNGVKNGKDFVNHKMKDTAGNREIKQYYEISLTKTVDGVEHAITDVVKDTDATGTLRITMRIPEEFRGYKHYSLIHVHNGETVLLTDLDDDPDTITFEVNRFSTFALTATNESLAETPREENISTEHYTTTVLNGGAYITKVDTAITGDVVIPDTIDGLPVIRIGAYAFENCTGITSITLPESLAKLGKYAFAGCTSLEAVIFAENGALTEISDFAFKGCTSLKAAAIPAGVKTIGSNAFFGCESLAAVTIPEGVTSIGKYAFAYCTSLASLILPEGLASIGAFAFTGCTALEAIILPESVTVIEKRAFAGCTSLVSVTLPKTVTTIGEYAFYACATLTTVTLEEGSALTEIGANAFRACAALSELALPAGVTIGANAFYSTPLAN